MSKTVALTLLCLTLLLVSCVRAPAKNPLHLTEDCPYPKLEKKAPTYRDAVLLAEKRGKALKKCTERMKSLRKI